jgi:fumarate reductase flavoprotein subunit
MKFGTHVSKRTILKLTAAAGLAISGFHRALADEDFDVIVVGGGTAGMPVAIAAAERGAKVLVIEKSDRLGGTLWLSGGQLAGSGTRIQKLHGIRDSWEQHYDDIMRLGHSKADPAIVRRFTRDAAWAVDWLVDLGLRIAESAPLMGESYTSFSMPRYYKAPGGGASIVKVLQPVFEREMSNGRISLLLNTSVKEIVATRDGAVTGVISDDSSHRRIQYTARNVVLATGGYCSNRKKFKELTGLTNYSGFTHPNSLGQGIDLGVAVGAFVRGAEHQVLTSAILQNRDYPSLAAHPAGTDSARTYGNNVRTDPRERSPWEIQINLRGERFMAEDNDDPDFRASAFTKQPTQRSWVVFDQRIYDAAPSLLPVPKEEADLLFNRHPMLFRADTPAKLATAMRLPSEQIIATIEEYNRGVKHKHDRFGRKHLPMPIERGPFYGIELSGTTVVSFGGLTVDADLRVLRRDGQAIPNLYAIGETIGIAATSGDAIISGGAITPAIALGRLLGHKILKFQHI